MHWRGREGANQSLTDFKDGFAYQITSEQEPLRFEEGKILKPDLGVLIN
jgi:hypothetical protein